MASSTAEGVEDDRDRQHQRGDHQQRPRRHTHFPRNARADGELPPGPDDLASHAEHVPDEVDLGVALGSPVDGELVDAEAGPLGAHEHLGVPEPVFVLDVVVEGLEGLAGEGP